MKLKGIIDCDLVNYKEPVLTLMFPYCNFKCDALNNGPVCQNSSLVNEPDIDVSFKKIWKMYKANPLTKGFCFQGLEPLDSEAGVYEFIDFVRAGKNCNDVIIIYTGYDRDEQKEFVDIIKNYPNIIIKWGRYIANQKPHYDEVLGVNLASDNQYAELVSKQMPISL